MCFSCFLRYYSVIFKVSNQFFIISRTFQRYPFFLCVIFSVRFQQNDCVFTSCCFVRLCCNVGIRLIRVLVILTQIGMKNIMIHKFSVSIMNNASIQSHSTQFNVLYSLYGNRSIPNISIIYTILRRRHKDP